MVKISVPQEIKRHKKRLTVLLLAWINFFACLWQLEIVHIHIQLGWELVDLPFFVYVLRINVWTFRDILYLGLFISMLLELIALWGWK